jgi:hypothetical protein
VLPSLLSLVAVADALDQLKTVEDALSKRGDVLARTNESLGSQESALQRLRAEVTSLRSQVDVSRRYR